MQIYKRFHEIKKYSDLPEPFLEVAAKMLYIGESRDHDYTESNI